MSLSYYLNETNPEIYQVTPRPGGIAKIHDDIKKKKPSKSFADIAAASQSKASETGKTDASHDSTAKSKTNRSIFDVAKDTSEKREDTEPSREYNIHRASHSFPWSAELDDDYADVKEDLPNPFQDSIDMLAITISTIMLLAADYGEIPERHLAWTLSYLECIKDEFGNYPPNVRGILNHINQKTGGKIISFNAKDNGDSSEHRGNDTKVSFSDEPAAASTPKQSIAEAE